MTRAAVPRRRSLHPVAWWLWAAGLAICAMRTNNPFLLALIGAVACVVVSARRSSAPWSRSIAFFLRLGLLVIVIRIVIEILFGQRGIPGHVLFTLPQVPLPVVGRRREHRRSGDAGVHPRRLRARAAARRDHAVLRRGELAGQPVPAAALASRGALRNRRGRDGGPVLRARVGAVHRDRAPGATPARHPDHRAARHAGRGGSGAGERAGPLAPAGHEHGRPRLRSTASQCATIVPAAGRGSHRRRHCC